MTEWFLIVWLGAMPAPTHQYILGPMTMDECHSLDINIFKGSEENEHTHPWYANPWHSHCIVQMPHGEKP